MTTLPPKGPRALSEEVDFELTRSSPIGPAEHDEGGSLEVETNVSQVSLFSYLIVFRVLFFGPTVKIVASGFGSIYSQDFEYSPAEICEFLVDTLQSHCWV